MKEENDIELIDQFLEGKLSASEADRVRERIRDDKEFADLFNDLKYVIESTRVAGREEMRNYLKGVAAAEGEPTSKTYLWYWVSGIAATIAIAVSLFVLLSKGPVANPNERLAASYFAPYPNVVVPVVRGVKEDSTARAIAFRHYELGEYELALEELSNIDSPTRDDLFYKGICSLALKDYATAVKHLKKYEEDGESFATQTKWYLALAYLGSGETDLCRTHLSDLATTDNSYRARASELLTKIK